MKKTLLLLATLLTTLGAMADNEILYGVYQGAGTLGGVGTQKAETYDVALHIASPELVGMEIRGLRIPVNTAAGATDYSAWLTSALTVEGGVSVPDICRVAFSPDKSWVDVDFEEPYTIPEGGVYAGYSLTIPAVDTNNSADPAKTPLMCLASTDNAHLYIHTSRTYRKWMSFAEDNAYIVSNYASALLVRLGGERVKSNAVALRAPADLESYSLVGKTKALTLTLINHGVQDAKNVDYTLEIGDQTISKHVSTSLKGTYYGREATLKVTIPAMQTAGSYPVRFTISKVNGVANEEEDSTVTMEMAFIEQLPKHKPLMEEYTGAWCQWCPRGMAAMEAMTELYGDDFVGIAYHNGDEMQLPNFSTPNNPSGYPHAYVDRVIDTDPFYGTSGASLGIRSDWQKREAILAPAALTLTAEWTDGDLSAIDVTASVSFIRSFESNPYRLAYVLLADSLYGEGRYWSQVNAFAGNTSFSSDPYLAPWVSLPGTVKYLRFNDVAIQASCNGAATIAESLPASVKGAEPYSHTYRFDVSENKLVQNPALLRAVVVLVDTRTGEVANAEKAVVQLPVGVQAVSASPSPADATYTDLAGRRITQPRRGVYVRGGKVVVVTK